MKKWYLSKTLWLAFLQAAAGILAAFILQFPEVALLLTGKSVVDVVLRFVTQAKLE